MNETKIEIIKNNDEPKKNIIIQEQFRSTKRVKNIIIYLYLLFKKSI